MEADIQRHLINYYTSQLGIKPPDGAYLGLDDKLWRYNEAGCRWEQIPDEEPTDTDIVSSLPGIWSKDPSLKIIPVRMPFTSYLFWLIKSITKQPDAVLNATVATIVDTLQKNGWGKRIPDSDVQLQCELEGESEARVHSIPKDSVTALVEAILAQQPFLSFFDVDGTLISYSRDRLRSIAMVADEIDEESDNDSPSEDPSGL